MIAASQKALGYIPCVFFSIVASSHWSKEKAVHSFTVETQTYRQEGKKRLSLRSERSTRGLIEDLPMHANGFLLDGHARVHQMMRKEVSELGAVAQCTVRSMDPHEQMMLAVRQASNT